MAALSPDPHLQGRRTRRDLMDRQCGGGCVLTPTGSSDARWRRAQTQNGDTGAERVLHLVTLWKSTKEEIRLYEENS
jgi:hypothetical protein